MLNELLLSPNIVLKKWIKPPKGVVKINFDAIVGDNRIGYGTIVRDDEGFVLEGGGGFIGKMMSVEEAECFAFEASIKLACQLKIKGHVLFETDHVGLINKLRNLATDVTIIDERIKECKDAFNNFNSADLIWTKWSCNTIVDLICTKICNEAKTWFFHMDYPVEFHNDVICDVM